MGFFIRCMADMLDSGQLQIDRETAFELPMERCSPDFYPGLRDMIATYSTIQFSCSPLGSQAGSAPLFALPPTGPGWSERFFGFSRRIVRLLGYVNGMVARRSQLLREGTDNAAAGLLLRAQAERLVGELGESWNWDESALDAGRSDRIQRGNEVGSRPVCVRALH